MHAMRLMMHHEPLLVVVQVARLRHDVRRERRRRRRDDKARRRLGQERGRVELEKFEVLRRFVLAQAPHVMRQRLVRRRWCQAWPCRGLRQGLRCQWRRQRRLCRRLAISLPRCLRLWQRRVARVEV